MANGRAQAGGQQGKNGEWYEGGQFLPSSTTTEKGAFGNRDKKQAKPRKQEIAPYKWEVSDKVAIWKKCEVGASTKFNQTGYSKETGAQGTLEIVKDTNFWNNKTEDNKAEIIEMVERWNNGERWI